MKFRNLEIEHDYGKVSFDVIKHVEEIFRVKFPSSYIELIKMHNGVSFFNDHFDYYNNYYNEDGVKCIGFRAFPEPNVDILDNILSQNLSDDEYGYEHMVIFADSAEGDYVCFDYRDNPDGDNPRIVVLHHDIYDDEINKMWLSFVANDFEEFLGKLYNYDERYS